MTETAGFATFDEICRRVAGSARSKLGADVVTDAEGINR
jgi:hypothetical protein